MRKKYKGTILAFLMSLALVLLQMIWPFYYEWSDGGGTLGMLLKATGLRVPLDAWFAYGSKNLAYTPVFILWSYSWFSLPFLVAAFFNRTKLIQGFIATLTVSGVLYIMAGVSNTDLLLLVAYYLASAPLLAVPYGAAYFVKAKLA